MQMWGWVQRYGSGRWNNLDSCTRGPYYGATSQQCNTLFDCYHPNSYRRYRAETQGYAIRNGVEYVGYDLSKEVQTKCH